MTYDTLRHLADSWGLLALAVAFLAVVAYAFRPGSREAYRDTARIPLDDDREI